MLKNGLRSLSVLIIVVLFSLLSGCNILYDETNKISESKELTVRDIASEFIINSETLATYKYKDDPNVSYVNINEFITFMKGGIVDLDITKSNVMTISYTFDVPSEYQEIYDKPTYTYKMTIDARREVISYNDFNMVSNLNVPTLSEYDTDLFVSDYEIPHGDNGDPSLKINLRSYDINIVLCEDGYYIPLYLANLFFTGSNINVYEMNDYIYVIDNFTDFDRLIKKFKENDNISVSDISFQTENYLALYFDYFYGLKDFKNIDTYRTILDSYDFEDKEDFDELHKELERFLYSNDDLHTSLISAGYMDKNYKPHIYNKPDDKLCRYLDSYAENKCYYNESEISYKTFDDAIVIHVNAFSLETKDLLKPAMKEAEKYDDIIIDVSCNPGGNVIGVIELLSYMTDKKIPVSYINSKTGEKMTEYYETRNNVYLDKNFYVYTSAATFSAANLFTSIVKDQELAIILGENTSGGASTITYTVLPDGAIIVNSSNMTLINKDDEIIEDGIEVDINLNIPINWYKLTANINNLFTYFSGISTDRYITSNSITYNFEIDSEVENINIKDYKLLVYDYETNSLLYEKHFKAYDFIYNIDKIKDITTYKVEVSVKYNVNNISREELIYTEIIDDHPNDFDVSAIEIPIDEKISANAYVSEDSDTFKFTVLETGEYRIELNDCFTSSSPKVYDEYGRPVGEGYDYKLKPGVYYVVAYIYDKGDYTIKIRKLVDDNYGPTIVNLHEGIQTHKLYYDYTGDEESFEFNLIEESMVTFSWDTEYDFYSYSITKSDGELFAPYSDRVKAKDDITIIMPKGTYIVKLNDLNLLGELNLTTTTSTDFDDYSGDTSLESDNYGKLVIGTNTMNFFTLWDEDVYYIDIAEPGNYIFEYDRNNGCVNYIKEEGTLEYVYPNYNIYLSQGRHYFSFSAYDRNSIIDFELIQDKDLNDENNMETIYVDHEITSDISNSTDVDYFKFYSNEVKTYMLNISGSTCGKFTIVDLEGNLIARHNINSFYFTVNEGTYILKVESYHSDQEKREKINLLITEYTGEDDAPNLLYLPTEYYDTVEMNLSNGIEGKINYENDYDVYIMNIKESGIYESYLHGRYVDMYCYYPSGKINQWNSGKTLYLEKGTYYLRVLSYHIHVEYKIAYEKVNYN